jgi:glycosyltransferase involved in cell wall biosynthesis
MTETLRVLYVNTFLNMNMGEALVSRHFLAAAQQTPGWEWVIVPPFTGPKERSTNGRSPHHTAAHHILPAALRTTFRHFLSPMSAYPVGPFLHRQRMRKHLQPALATPQQFDVLLLHPSQGDLGALAELARRVSLPIVLRAPGPFAYQADRVFGRHISRRDRQNEQYLYRRATAVCVISEHMKALTIRELGTPAEKLVVVPNGVDFAGFGPRPAERQAVRQKLGLNGRFVAGYVGGFWAGNDLDTLLCAWQRVEAACPDSTLLLLGEGPGRPAAQSLSQRLGLRRCLWLDRVPHDAVPHYLAALDVGIGPYVASALEFVSPLKVMEYMAMGLPVVAADGGQITELVEHGATGYLYPPGDAARLAAELVRLAEDRAMAVAFGHNARQRILHWPTWPDMAGRLMAVCRAAAKGKSLETGDYKTKD